MMTYQKIVLLLKGIPGVRGIWLVGLERGDRGGVFDLLMACDGGIEKYAAPIIDKLRNAWPHGTFSCCDDSVRLSAYDVSGGVAVCDTCELKRRLSAWVSGSELNGEHRSWAAGYWVPEALCGDLATAVPLYDPDNIHEWWGSLLVPYPKSLSVSLCGFCADEIDQKKKALVKLDDNQVIETNLIISDIASALIRFAFARSGIYLRGFKNIRDQSNNLSFRDKDLILSAERISMTSFVDDKEKLVSEISDIQETKIKQALIYE